LFIALELKELLIEFKSNETFLVHLLTFPLELEQSLLAGRRIYPEVHLKRLRGSP
jgi:hypothetical protein